MRTVIQIGRVVDRRLFAKSFRGGSRTYSTHRYLPSEDVSQPMWLRLGRIAVASTALAWLIQWPDSSAFRSPWKVFADAKSRCSERPLVDGKANEEILLDHRADKEETIWS